MSIPYEAFFEVVKKYEKKGEWYVEGLCVTSAFDHESDIILPSAMKEIAVSLVTNKTVLRNHNLDEEIGVVKEAKALEFGVWVKVLISKTVPKIWTKIEEGVLNKFSIRGKIKEWTTKTIKSIGGKVARIIKSMTTIEISLVSVPMNSEAAVLAHYVEKAFEAENEENGNITNNQPKEGGDKRMSLNLKRLLGQKYSSEETEKALTSFDELIKNIKSEAGEDDKDQLGVLDNLLETFKALASEVAVLEKKAQKSAKVSVTSKVAPDEGDTLDADTVKGVVNEVLKVPLATINKALEPLKGIVKDIEEGFTAVKGLIDENKEAAEKRVDAVEKVLTDLVETLEATPLRKGVNSKPESRSTLEETEKRVEAIRNSDVHPREKLRGLFDMAANGPMSA